MTKWIVFSGLVVTIVTLWVWTSLNAPSEPPLPPPEVSPLVQEYEQELKLAKNKHSEKLAPVATNLRGRPIYVSAFKSVDISPDGKYLAAGSGEGVIMLWDLNTSQNLWSRKVSSSWIFDLHFSSDSTKLAVANGDNQVDVLRLNQGTLLHSNSDHQDDVHGVRFLPGDAQILSGSDDTSLQLWNFENNNSSKADGHEKQVTAVAVSPDGKLIASASRDKTVKVWNPETLELITTLEGHTADVMAIDFDSTSKFLISGGYDKSVRLWNLETQEEIKKFTDFNESVFATRFQPNGELIAVSDGQGMLRFLNWKTGETVQQELFSSDIPSLDFSDEGTTLALVTVESEAILLEFENGKWVKQPHLPIPKPKGSNSTSQTAFHLPPDELLELIDSLQNPKDPDWEPNFGKVVLNAAGVPREILEPLADLPLTAPQQEMLDRSLARFSKQSENDKPTPELITAIGPRLELAAYSDLLCHPYELVLSRWANDSLSKFKKQEVVMQELKRLQQEYRATIESKYITKESLEKRVQSYLETLLSPDNKSVEAKQK